MLIRRMTVLGVAAATIAGAAYSDPPPDPFVAANKLQAALQTFEREIAGKKDGAAARSRKSREIVVVGSKVKDAGRSSRASAGFSEVTGLNRDAEPVEYRSGAPASLPQLRNAIRQFEKTVGPASTCVKSCRASARRCIAQCKSRLRAKRIKGRCICAAVRARCLIRESKQRKCHPPEPGKQPRGRLGPLRR